MTFQHYWNVGLPNIFMKNIDLFYFLPASFPVRRVHWLHAHAQQMRWQEEVTITTYEMQSTKVTFGLRFKMHQPLMD